LVHNQRDRSIGLQYIVFPDLEVIFKKRSFEGPRSLDYDEDDIMGFPLHHVSSNL
jgi:hypothetical protein